MKKPLFIFVSALLLMGASCATYPEDILPVAYTGKAFGDYSCEQLARRSTRLEAQLTRLYFAQEKRAKGDFLLAANVYGWAVLFPPLAFLGFLARGDDLDAEKIAQIKGEMAELDVYFNRRC